MAGRGFVENLVATAQSAAAKLRVRSALNPMLWLCAIVSLPCFGLAYLTQANSIIAAAFVVIGALPILATIRGFLYFMTAAPDKLQSEEYQIRHETLDLIREKGSSLEVIPSSLEAITNPVIEHVRRGEDK
jgi:hypothetical protein